MNELKFPRCALALAIYVVMMAQYVLASTQCSEFSTAPKAVPGGILETQEFLPDRFVSAAFVGDSEIAISTNNEEFDKTIAQVIDSRTGEYQREFLLDLASVDMISCPSNGTMAFITVAKLFPAGIMILQPSFHLKSGAPWGQIGRTSMGYSLPARFSSSCHRFLALFDDGKIAMFDLQNPIKPAVRILWANNSTQFGMADNRFVYVLMSNRRGQRRDLLRRGRTVLPQIRLPANPVGLAIHPTGRFIFFVGKLGNTIIKQYIQDNGRFRVTVDNDALDLELVSIEASPSGTHFAAVITRADDTVVKIYNADPSRLAITLVQTISVGAIDAKKALFSPDGRSLLVVGSEQSRKIRVSVVPEPVPVVRRG